MDHQQQQLDRPLTVDPRYAVEPNGSLVGADQQSAQILAARTGTYSIAHTSPDWLLFLKTPAGGGVATTRPRVVLAGDCATFPLSDMIAFLGQSRWTGVLRLSSPEAERALALKDGEVRWANSDAPNDRMGEIMVRLGYVTRAQLESVLKDTPPSRVGRVLVERGIMQAHDLWKCLTEQVSEVFHALMLTHEGAFVLIDQELDDKQAHHLNLSMQSLLMDSIRKIDEMAHFRKKIPHARLYVGKKRPSDGTLEPEEDTVLGLIDGHKTVLELGMGSRLGEFDITRVVFRLIEGGFAQVAPQPFGAVASIPAPQASAPRGAPAPVAVAPAAVDEQKVLNVFNFIFREVRNEVARRGKLDSFLQGANAALSSSTLSTSPLLNGMQFQADGSLPDGPVLEQYARLAPTLGSEPLGTFKQALSDVMFFLLFQAGELLETHADEALARRVKDMLATLDGA